jgi:hypothetical protein
MTMPPRLERVIEEKQIARHKWCYKPDMEKTNEKYDDLITQTALAAWNAALEAVREGVPPEVSFHNHDYPVDHIKGHNTCRTALTDHINSLGV